MSRFREHFPSGRLEPFLSLIGIALLLGLAVCSGCTQPVIPYPAPVTTTQPPAPPTAATVAPQAPTSQATQKAADYLTYTNTQYGFTMSYPVGWSMQENTGGSVVVFQAPLESRDDLYQENMKVIVEDLSSSPMSLDQYRTATLAKRQTLDQFNKIIDGPYKISGFNGWKIAYKGNTGMLMEWVEIFTIKGTTVYDLLYSAQESHYANYVVQMDYMFKSFQLIS